MTHRQEMKGQCISDFKKIFDNYEDTQRMRERQDSIMYFCMFYKYTY